MTYIFDIVQAEVELYDVVVDSKERQEKQANFAGTSNAGILYWNDLF